VRRSFVALVFAGWTGFVWLTRIRNAARNADSVLAYAMSVAFLVLAIGIVATMGRDRRWVFALAALTAVVWPIRLVDIAASHHSLGFVIVHAAIGMLSVGLAAFAVRAALNKEPAVAA